MWSDNSVKIEDNDVNIVMGNFTMRLISKWYVLVFEYGGTQYGVR